MKFRTKYVALLVTLLLLSIVLTGCGGGSGKDGTGGQTANDTFVVGRSTDATLIDPGYTWSEGGIDIVFHIFDGLVQFKNDKLEVEPALATEWSKNDEGTVWTFKLRQGVKFHDGTDFTADAVVTSFKRVIDENNKYYNADRWSYLKYLLGDVIEDVEAQDDYTVVFTLKNKFAPFLTYMGYYSQYIISPAALEKYGDDFYKHPVGTGPFKFVEWKKDDYIKLEANDDYWGEKPKIKNLIFKTIPESTTRLMELESGQVHAIKGIDPAQLDKINNNKELQLLRVPGANLFYVALNNQAEPLNNKKVRQAINYAIDMDKLVESTYEGLGTRAKGALPPTVFGYDDTIGWYDYNPEKAKQLLNEAGYPNGFDIELLTFTKARPYVPKPVEVAEVIASDLKKVGINARVVTNEWASHLAIMEKSDHKMAQTGWYDIPYPSNFMKTMALDGGHLNYAPDRMVELANKALATYDRSQQENYYKEMQQIFREDAPMIPIAHNDYTAAVRKDVKGFKLDVMGTVRMHNASIEK